MQKCSILFECAMMVRHSTYFSAYVGDLVSLEGVIEKANKHSEELNQMAFPENLCAHCDGPSKGEVITGNVLGFSQLVGRTRHSDHPDVKTPGISHNTGWDGHPKYPQHRLPKRGYHDTSTGLKIITFSLLYFCVISEQTSWDASDKCRF